MKIVRGPMGRTCPTCHIVFASVQNRKLHEEHEHGIESGYVRVGNSFHRK